MNNKHGSVPCGARIQEQPGSVGCMNAGPGVIVHTLGQVPGSKITATTGTSGCSYITVSIDLYLLGEYLDLLLKYSLQISEDQVGV